MGPFPTSSLLTRLSGDPNETIRAKAAYLLGLHLNDALQPRLFRLLKDSDPIVQRIACESCVRANAQATAKRIASLAQFTCSTSCLGSDAFARNTSARTISRCRAESRKRPRLFARRISPYSCRTRASTLSENRRAQQCFVGGYLNDADFLAMLRLTQLALAQGKIKPADTGSLGEQLAREFPTSDAG